MVKIEQIYTGCLAQAAYFVESNGEAAIIDPLRETAPYVQAAAKANAKIKYVFETHFHADFVSGHVDLANAVGAQIVYGPTAAPDFEALVVEDGQKLTLGGCTITCLHTPGHTMESTTYLLHDEEGKPKCIFTGDTLFIGDVGRPDLAQKAASMTQEQLAGMLFRSLRTKIMPLPPQLIVYPAHGAGSACGKNLSSETFDTLEHQLATNYALRADMTEEEFVRELTTGLAAPPEYFPAAVAMNKHVNESIDHILEAGRRALTPAELQAEMAKDPKLLVVDTRDNKQYIASYIPGSVFCGIDGGFGPWFATAHPDQSRRIAFIAKSDDRIDEISTRFARVGFDNVIGHLAGGFDAWVAAGLPTDKMERVTAAEFAALLEDAKNKNSAAPYTIDLRRPGELARAHYPEAVNLPLSTTALTSVEKERDVFAFCAGGYRSLIYTSALKNLYKHTGRAVDIDGGFFAMEQDAAFAPYVVKGECPNAYRARIAAEKEKAAQ